ncbi:MAG: cysteine desulfurase family protein, partial [Candidatus Zixiibacteriota bacterium]
ALEQSRETIARVINCQPSELYFTSGGTESDNLAVFGAAFQLQERRKHLVIGATEHHAVLEAAHHLQDHHGWEVSILPVDSKGFASPETLAELVSDKTALVSVMHANNETGTIQDIGALVKVAHARGALFHTDAVQSVGKIPVDVRAMDVDLLSLTGHKIYGPKGSGGLFIKQGIKITPLFYGGSHEKKRRPGTENIAGIVGLAKALEIASTRRDSDHESMSRLATYFISAITTTIPDAIMNSPLENRVPPTINISFPGFAGESIVLALDMEGIAVSSGSACTSGAVEPSHVLMAMGVPTHVALGAVRFSLGRSTTREQLDHVLNILPPVINRLRSLSPTAGR